MQTWNFQIFLTTNHSWKSIYFIKTFFPFIKMSTIKVKYFPENVGDGHFLLCLTGSFLSFCCGIFSYFVFFHAFLFCWKFRLSYQQTSFFSRRCFDAFSEPQESNQTKYSIHMLQQLNGHKIVPNKGFTFKD